jgi:hypothetical protein
LPILIEIFLIVFVLNLALVLYLSSAWNESDTSASKFILTGKYIYQDFEKYIRKDRVKIYKFLNFTALLFFVLLIFSIVFSFSW